jgi:hypothetical protein
MNEHTPLTPEAVDALLSADLDGEIEAAARDLGFGASEARARLAATPGVEARRGALTRARDLIASRPLLEASMADKLVAAAAPDDMAIARARRSRNERRWRVLVAAGSVAAAVAVIVGISSMDNSTSSKASRALTALPSTTRRAGGEGAATANTPAVGSRPDFGDVSNPAALRAPARRVLSLQTNDSNITPTKGAKSGPVVPDTSTGSTAQDAESFAASGGPACTTTRLRSYDITTRPALIARGTVAGAPVAILIYEGSGNPYAYVIRVSDCSLVRKQSLG